MNELRYHINGSKYSLIGAKWYTNDGVLITDTDIKRYLFSHALEKNRVPVGADDAVGGGGGTNDYNALINKPQINGTVLLGNRSIVSLGLASAAQGLKADTALLSYTETDPTVGSHIKAITTTLIANWDAMTASGAGIITESDPIYIADKPNIALKSELTTHNSDTNAHPAIRQLITDLAFIKDASYNSTTGDVVLTRRDNSIISFNIFVDNLVKDLNYDSVTHELIIVKKDDTEIRINISDLIDIYVGSNGAEIQISIGSGNVIQATLKAGTVTKSHLINSVQTSLDKADSAYLKPSLGIPASDLETGIIPDISNFVQKTGDTMSGVLHLDKLSYIQFKDNSLLPNNPNIAELSAYNSHNSLFGDRSTIGLYALAYDLNGNYDVNCLGFELRTGAELSRSLVLLQHSTAYLIYGEHNKPRAIDISYNNTASSLVATNVLNAIDEIVNNPPSGNFYTKPSTGIPATDLAAGVIPDVSGFVEKSGDIMTGNLIFDLGNSSQRRIDFINSSIITHPSRRIFSSIVLNDEGELRLQTAIPEDDPDRAFLRLELRPDSNLEDIILLYYRNNDLSIDDEYLLYGEHNPPPMPQIGLDDVLAIGDTAGFGKRIILHEGDPLDISDCAHVLLSSDGLHFSRTENGIYHSMASIDFIGGTGFNMHIHDTIFEFSSMRSGIYFGLDDGSEYFLISATDGFKAAYDGSTDWIEFGIDKDSVILNNTLVLNVHDKTNTERFLTIGESGVTVLNLNHNSNFDPHISVQVSDGTTTNNEQLAYLSDLSASGASDLNSVLTIGHESKNDKFISIYKTDSSDAVVKEHTQLKSSGLIISNSPTRNATINISGLSIQETIGLVTSSFKFGPSYSGLEYDFIDTASPYAHHGIRILPTVGISIYSGNGSGSSKYGIYVHDKSLTIDSIPAIIVNNHGIRNNLIIGQAKTSELKFNHVDLNNTHIDVNVYLSGSDSVKVEQLAYLSDMATKYTKISTGIPKSDLADDVQDSLEKADIAITSPNDSIKFIIACTEPEYNSLVATNLIDNTTIYFVDGAVAGSTNNGFKNYLHLVSGNATYESIVSSASYLVSDGSIVKINIVGITDASIAMNQHILTLPNELAPDSTKYCMLYTDSGSIILCTINSSGDIHSMFQWPIVGIYPKIMLQGEYFLPSKTPPNA